jgi:hypothetical protein
MRRQPAVLTALTLSLSACGTSHAAPPALSKSQAERVLANYQSVNNRANSALDGNLLATIETGAQLEMDRATYLLRRAKNDKYSAFGYTAPTYYIPRQTGYPRWFAVDTTSGRSRHALLFVQDRSGGPWLLAADPLSAAPLSGVALDKDGYATAVAPDDTDGALAPGKVAGVHAAALTTGAAGMAAGPYTSQSRDALVKVQTGLRRRGVTLTSVFTPDRQRTFALRASGGGALVWYVLRQSEKYDMSRAGAVSGGGDLTGLVNGRIGRHLDTVALTQYLARVPDSGAPQVIGSYRKAISATTS